MSSLWVEIWNTVSKLGDLAKEHGLERVGKRPPLKNYLSEVWKRRAFAWTLSTYRLLASTARSRLGIAWLVLVPALQITVYGLIFGLVLGDSRPDNFLPFLIVGVVVFQFLAGSFSDGARSITSNSSLAKSLSFPRVLLPLSAMVSQWLKFAGLLSLASFSLLFFGEYPRWSWLLIFAVIGLASLFAGGVAMISARLTVHFNDLSQLIPFITRVAFYASGVFFSVDRLTASIPWLGFLEWANPVSVYLSLARDVMISGHAVDAWMWGVGAAWGVVTLLVGFFFFWSAEERYGRAG
jgi:teichoic acid transport system permease protein